MIRCKWLDLKNINIYFNGPYSFINMENSFMFCWGSSIQQINLSNLSFVTVEIEPIEMYLYLIPLLHADSCCTFLAVYLKKYCGKRWNLLSVSPWFNNHTFMQRDYLIVWPRCFQRCLLQWQGKGYHIFKSKIYLYVDFLTRFRKNFH